MNKQARLIVGALAATACLGALLAPARAQQSQAPSQPVYRCGDSYSQQPCAAGKALDVADPRSAEQRAQAAQATQRDAQAAAALEKDRLRREREARPATPVAQAETAREPAPRAEDKPVMSKPRKPEYFTAIAPRPADGAHAKKKKKKKKTSA